MNSMRCCRAVLCAAVLLLLPSVLRAQAKAAELVRVLLCDTPGERAPAWMAKQGPDIAVLTGYAPADAAAAAAYAARYGHPYAAVSDSRVGRVTVTSKYPIETVAAALDTPGDPGFLHVRIAGRDFVVLRLTPFDGYHRLREAEDAVRYLEVHQLTETCTILGSFGSVPLADQEALRDAPGALGTLAGGTDAMALGTLDAAVQATFMALSYHDPLSDFVPLSRRTRGFSAETPSVHTLHILVPKADTKNVRGAAVYEAYPERTYFGATPVSVTFAPNAN